MKFNPTSKTITIKTLYSFVILFLWAFNLYAQPTNDNQVNAIELTDLNSWSSSDAAYSNEGATADGNPNGCFSNPKHNVWFKFVATTSEIEIKVHTGDGKGTMGYQFLSLLDASGTAMECNYNSGRKGIAYIQNTSLVAGSTYYISVDNNAGNSGTFTLEVTDNIDYDLNEKAEIITHAPSWCSTQEQFSSLNATADGSNDGTCGDFKRNVWFSLQATSDSISIQLQTGEGYGTLSYPVVYLLDEAGNTLSCASNSSFQSVQIDYYSLSIGSQYYISVDNYAGNSGTFTLCVAGGVESNQLCQGIFCDGMGGIGVGTTVVPQGYRLAVDGKIISEGVKVALQENWPDFVFDEDYGLMDLPELKKYIAQAGHLPDVPSALQVEEEGIELEKMNVLLLQKIEELTLHIIKLEERIAELESKSK